MRKKLWLLVWVATLSACAWLPSQREVKTLQYELTDELTVVDGERLVSGAEADALLQRALGTPAKVAAVNGLLRMEEVISGNPLVLGNSLELLIDGPETYAAMFESISAAKSHIHLQIYIFTDDPIGEELAALLQEKAAKGIEVRLIYDAIGGLFVDEVFYQKLADAGVQVAKFNPVDPLEDPRLWRINHRDHSKLLVVDGRVAFTGGLNISGVYERRSSRISSLPAPTKMVEEHGWRDTHVQVSGPAVTYMQHRFIEAWRRLTGEDLESDLGLYPKQASQKWPGAMLRLQSSDGADSDYEIYEMYLAAIHAAQKNLWITQAYFAPNDTVLSAIKRAAKRGVDVRIILPGLLDQGLVYHSSRSRYEALLEAGVRLYEFEDRVLHAKTIVMDGQWATVGSANFDFRSFIHNNELNLSVLDTEFADTLQKQFLLDIAHSQEVELTAWRARPLSDKLKEQAARLLDYWL